MDISTGWLKSNIHTWIYPWISISTASLRIAAYIKQYFIFAVHDRRRRRRRHLFHKPIRKCRSSNKHGETLNADRPTVGSDVVLKVKVKVKSSTCYSSASYMTRTQDQKRFTILEVAADWHELMIPQRTMRPSIARVNEQMDPRFAAIRHTIAPISHTRLSPRSS